VRASGAFPSSLFDRFPPSQTRIALWQAFANYHLGVVTAATPIITTVHALQIVTGRIALKPHDIPVDFIVTPVKTIQTKTRLSRPGGIYWDYLNEEMIAAIPLLKKMRNNMLAGRGVER
jgi:hypothetical protein